MVERVSLEDEEGVIKGPHYYLVRKQPLDRIESEVYDILREHGPMPLSEIWRRLNCHLWEVTAALARLKRKGLVEEADVTPEAYGRI
ncbi:MAG: helix-turn-helix domain-containing protein [Candidatus Bathyarchaeia archaeon]|nr:MarR family transcriptional regulator [Candidatus Bathyarchaeota archaeon]